MSTEATFLDEAGFQRGSRKESSQLHETSRIKPHKFWRTNYCVDSTELNHLTIEL